MRGFGGAPESARAGQRGPLTSETGPLGSGRRGQRLEMTACVAGAGIGGSGGESGGARSWSRSPVRAEGRRHRRLARVMGMWGLKVRNS